MWRMLLQQNFLELCQLCFHEVLIRWFSTWVAHWETTKVVSGVACRKLPGFSKHFFFKAQERSCPKTIKNRGKGHDNVCLLFLISADCVICKSHLVLVAVPTQVFFYRLKAQTVPRYWYDPAPIYPWRQGPKVTGSKVESSCWPHMDQGIGHDWTAGDHLPSQTAKVLNQILLWPVTAMTRSVVPTSFMCDSFCWAPGLWVGRLQARAGF